MLGRISFVFGVVLAGSIGCRHAAETQARRAPEFRPAPAAASRRPRVYVSNERSGDVSVIDPATNQVVAIIPVGKRPRGIRVSRDGRTVWVALSGSPIAGPNVKDEDLPPADKKADGIGVIDAATGKFRGKIAGGSDPEQFSLSPDERYLFASNEDESKATIVDLAAGRIVASLGVGLEPEGVATSPDGKVVYVSSESEHDVAVIDTATRTVVTRIKTGLRPRSVAFLPNSSKAYVTCENGGCVTVVDVAGNKVIKEVKLEGQNVKPMGVVVSPDGRRAYVATGRGQTVVALDTATDEVVGSVRDVGARPWGIGITPDGKTLYTANGPSNDVSVIDAHTLQITSRIKAGESPWGIAVGP
jgi:PQQ-dependent catabolism-associated beta-propeller protein